MSFAQKLVQVMTELQAYRQGSHVFAGKHGFITPRDLFRWAERRSLDQQVCQWIWYPSPFARRTTTTFSPSLAHRRLKHEDLLFVVLLRSFFLLVSIFCVSVHNCFHGFWEEWCVNVSFFLWALNKFCACIFFSGDCGCR